MNEMLDFLKALASADRLRIVGLLTRTPASQAGIAAQLNLPVDEVVEHLTFLEQVGAVRLQGEVYELDAEKLAALARDQLGQECQSYVPAPGLDPGSQKVLRAYLNRDGSLKQLPTQLSKMQVILKYLVQAFAPHTDYSEREVNSILRRFHEDTAGLRRSLVDAGLLDREGNGSRYWRIQ